MPLLDSGFRRNDGLLLFAESQQPPTRRADALK